MNLNSLLNAERSQFRNHSLTVFALILLSGFLRFFMLTHQSLWIDEGYTLEISDALNFQDFIQKIREIDASASLQPLHYFLLFLWRKIFGSSEFSVRSLSALSGVGASVVVYLTALKIYGRQHAVLSLLFITLSAFCIYYSQEARNYSLLIFLASLQLYFLADMLWPQQASISVSKVCFWITAGIGLFCSVTYIIFLASLAIAQLIVLKNLRQWLSWWVPTGIFLLPAIVYFALLPTLTAPDEVAITRYGLPVILNTFFVIYGLLVGTTYGPSTAQLRGDLTSKLQVLLSYAPQMIILVIVGLFLLIAITQALLNSASDPKVRSKDFFFATAVISVFVISLAFAIVTKINWVPRHSGYIWIPFAILLPIILLRGQTSRDSRARLSIPLIAALGFVILNIYSFLNYYFNAQYYRDDYRAAAQYLIDNRDSNTKSLLLLGSHYLLEYYKDLETIDANKMGHEVRKSFLKGEYKGNLADTVGQLTSGSKSVLVGVNREYLLPEGFVKQEMGKQYKLASAKDFTYFNIYRFEKRE
jgi:uncharacterized membrane protein